VRFLPRVIGIVLALSLFAVVGYLAYEGWHSVDEPSSSNRDVERIDVEASLQRDGALAVRTTYRFRKPVDEMSAFLPKGVSAARVNGVPVSSFVHFEARGVATDTVVVEWDIRGQTTRTSADAVVEWPLSRSLIEVVGDFDPVVVRAVLYVPGTAYEATSNLGDGNTGFSSGAVLLSGRTGAWSDADAVVRVDAAAVPDAPLSDRGSGVTYGGEAVRLANERPRTLFPTAERSVELVATILLTVFGGLFFLAYIWNVLRSAGRVVGTKARGLGQRNTPPDGGLPPALVGVATGAAGRGERSLVAATILELTTKGAISLDGITSEDFVMRVGPEPPGVTNAQRVVGRALRAEAGVPLHATEAELRGPPLWSDRKPKALRPYRRAILGEARRAGLVSTVFSGMSLFAMTIVCGVLGAMATQSPWGVILATIGPWVALVAVALNGTSLTKKGRLVRSQGEEYARYLRENTELGEVGAPGVVLWGDTLAYAAVLGAAPKAAKALSPRLSRKG
jgi:hypothetical protein